MEGEVGGELWIGHVTIECVDAEFSCLAEGLGVYVDNEEDPFPVH